MPLPQPTFLPYRPNEFVSAEPTVSRGLELFAKYHPAQMQQARFEQLRAEFKEQDLAVQEQRKLIQQELQDIAKSMANFRETGLGPSGRAGGVDAVLRGGRGGAGRGGDGRAALTNAAANLAEGYTDRKIAAARLSREEREDVMRDYELRQTENIVINQVVRDADRQAGGASGLDAAVLSGIVESVMIPYLERVDPNQLTDQQRKQAAATMYETLLTRFPGAVDPRVASQIDKMFRTNFFVTSNLGTGRNLNDIVREEKRARLQAAGINLTEEDFEREAAQELMAAEASGASPDQIAQIRKRVEERRRMLGFKAPLTDEEQLFMRTYINALRDDGVATPDEFSSPEQFMKAEAAYEKGRSLETLPRGFAPFYDESYLRNIGRLGELRGQLAQLEGREPAGQRAARVTLGLPQVSAQDFMAAAQVSPLAAEALPYTIQRFNDAGGDIQPRDRVERTAMQLITASGRDRNFPAFAQQVNKLYDNPSDRQKAFALYGAYYMAQDARGSTLNPGTLTGNPAEAARSAAQLASVVTPAGQFAAEAAPTPLPTPAALSTPTVGREQVRARVEALRPESGPTYVDEFGSPISIEGMVREAGRGNLSPYMTAEDYFAQQAGLR